MKRSLFARLRLEQLEARHVPNQMIMAIALEIDAFAETAEPFFRSRQHSTKAATRAAQLDDPFGSHSNPATPPRLLQRTVAHESLETELQLVRDPSDDGRSLSYVDYSNGLQVPNMEKGKTEIEFGDVNNDGFVDLLSIGDHGSPNINSNQNGIMVWFGNRLGNWALHEAGNFGYGGIALGDVNGDALMDVGYSMHHNWSSNDFGDQLIEVALGDGTGKNWTPWDDGLASSGEDYGMFETDFADVDNDGDLDVGAVSFGCCSGVHVYLNQGNGSWAQSFGILGGNTRNNFFFGDVNGDGNADFASGHSGNTVYLGDGQAGFQAGDGNLPPAGNGGRGGVSLGDINSDGRDDLAYVTNGGAVLAWTWVSNGVWQNLSNGLPTSGPTEIAQIADMNLDGNGDIVAFAKGLVTVYEGDGAGNWTATTSFSTPGIYGYAAFRTGTDVDRNGFPDIGVVAAEGSSSTNARNRPHVYVESSVPSELWVYAKSPRGGETFKAGSTRFIDWHAAVPQSIRRATMSIELSVDGPNGPWTSIVNAAKNNGRYQWHIPEQTPATTNAYLRFTLRSAFGDASTVTPGPFTILLA